MSDKKQPAKEKTDKKDEVSKDLQPPDGQATTVKGGVLKDKFD